MKAKASVIIFALLLASFALAGGQTEKCKKKYPNLQAGHIELTDENYTKWKNANSMLHILGVSDSTCEDCCQTETILAKLKDLFDKKVFTGKKGKKIEIGRADISKNYNFFNSTELEQLFIDTMPKIFVMH